MVVNARKSDSELLDGLLKRDPDALADTYDQYGTLVFSVLLRITRDRAAAEDLMQEIFLRIWNRISDFDVLRGSFTVWVLSIARNMAIDYIRSIRARSSLRIQFCETASPIRDPLEDADLVRRLFLRLTREQRELLELAYFEGYSQIEIADKLNIPLGTIKSRTRAALQRIRETLAVLSNSVPLTNSALDLTEDLVFLQ